MANKYRSVLASGGGVQPTGNAQPADVLSGKTFSNADGIDKTGTMPNNGAVSQTLNGGQSYTIPAGYHNGSGVVTALVGDVFLNDNQYLNANTHTISTYTVGTGFIIPVSEFAIVNVSKRTNVAYVNSTNQSSPLWGIKNGVITSIGTVISGSNTDISAYDYLLVNPASSGNSTFTFT